MTSLADESLPDTVRQEVALALSNSERKNVEDDIGKPSFPKVTSNTFWEDIPEGQELSGLAKLIGPSSWLIPNILKLSEDDMAFLRKDVH